LRQSRKTKTILDRCFQPVLPAIFGENATTASRRIIDRRRMRAPRDQADDSTCDCKASRA